MTIEDDLRAALRAQAQALRVPERPAVDVERRGPDVPDALSGRSEPKRTRWTLTIAATVVAVLIAGLALVTQRDDTTPANILPPPSTEPTTDAESSIFRDVHGWIAFRSGQELVAVDPDNPANRVSFAASADTDPIGWSSDGTRLLLRPHPDQQPEFSDGQWWTTVTDSDITVLSSDGSRAQATSEATWGSFSPDGTEIVYADVGSRTGPFIVDADGGDDRLLGRPRATGERLPEWAAWSPDGSRIAFVDFREYHRTYGHHAYTLSFLDPGTGETLGDEINISAAGPSWSPDGTRLAFWAVVLDEDADRSNPSLGPGGDHPAQIFVINADGSGLRQLTHEDDNRWPTWSPDGSRIAFARGQVAVATAPDGSNAAFVPPGSRQLSTMASDGTDVQEVAGVHPEGPIAWHPTPRTAPPTPATTG